MCCGFYISTLPHMTTNSTYLFLRCLSSIHHSENPKIRLPRHLRTKLITLVGEKVNLVIPFQVSPCLAELFWPSLHAEFWLHRPGLQQRSKTSSAKFEKYKMLTDYLVLNGYISWFIWKVALHDPHTISHHRGISSELWSGLFEINCAETQSILIHGCPQFPVTSKCTLLVCFWQ